MFFRRRLDGDWCAGRRVGDEDRQRNNIANVIMLAARRVIDGIATGETAARAVRIVAVAILAVHVVLAWSARQTAIGIRHDDAQYLLLGESLKHGSYRDVFLSNSPTHHMYPPAYPAILMLWSLVVGKQIALLTVPNIIASTIALALMFLTVQKLWSPALGLASLAILSVNTEVVVQAGRLATETPYMCFSVVALCALAFEKPPGRLILIAGLASIAATLTRPAGATLLAAVCLSLIVDRRLVAAFGFAAGAAFTAGSWLLWSLLDPQKVAGRSYIADASLLVTGHEPIFSSWVAAVRHATRNLYDYLGFFVPELLLPSISGTAVDNVFFVVVLVLGFGTGLLACFRRWRVAALYIVAYGALLVVWPYRWPRYAEPLLVLVVPLLLIGLAALGRRVSPAVSTLAVLVLTLTLVIRGSVATAALVRDAVTCRPKGIYPDSRCLTEYRASFYAALQYIDAKLPGDAVLRSGKPATVYYYTGRTSISRSRRPSELEGDILGLFRASGVGYILMDSVHYSSNLLAKELKVHCHRLALETSFPPWTYLFRVLEEGEVMNDDRACHAVDSYIARDRKYQ